MKSFLFFSALSLFSNMAFSAVDRQPIQTVQEADIQRLVRLGVITSKSNLDYEVETWNDNTGKPWIIQKITARGGASPVFFVPHDNEQDAYRTAIDFLLTYNHGTLVALECGEKRMCDGTDPNRYFCNKSYQDKLFSYFRGERFVVALHNNAPGCVQDGGAGNINAKFPYSGAQGFPRGPTQTFGDADDVVIHNGKVPPEGFNDKLRKFLEFKKINEIYEKQVPENDCSMSFAAYPRKLYYVNIDAKDRSQITNGHRIQYNILDLLMNWGKK